MFCSAFNVTCIRKHFLFMKTGWGKGLFNIFVGILLMNDPEKLRSIVFGGAMIFAGLIFLFLSRVKHMADEELDRAVSVTRASVARNTVKRKALETAQGVKPTEEQTA